MTKIETNLSKSLASYIARMAMEMRYYDISPSKLDSNIRSIENEKVRKKYREVLKTTDSLASYCSDCGNDKVFDQKREEYYCPVCH